MSWKNILRAPNAEMLQTSQTLAPGYVRGRKVNPSSQQSKSGDGWEGSLGLLGVVWGGYGCPLCA